mmetsp:Transcript_29317/g.40868  ORF Transcript_29317/g.40868 Transcript_29317/m.40868 type:complete len:110 (+) Transcript_29317:101-430(+)
MTDRPYTIPKIILLYLHDCILLFNVQTYCRLKTPSPDALPLHSRVRWASSPFGDGPADVLFGSFDRASFAMQAVLSVDLKARIRTVVLCNVLIDLRGTEMLLRTTIFGV